MSGLVRCIKGRPYGFPCLCEACSRTEHKNRRRKPKPPRYAPVVLTDEQRAKLIARRGKKPW